MLLGRRAIEPYRGLWDTPGGYLEEHEHPLDGLRRELLRGDGPRVEPIAFLGVWMDWYGDGPGASVDAQPRSGRRGSSRGDPAPADDVAELALVRAPTSCRPRTSSRSSCSPPSSRPGGSGRVNVVFLFDVDNTLLDNDRVAADLRRHLDTEVGADCGAATGRSSRSCAPSSATPTTSARCSATATAHPRDLRILDVSHFLISYPFANRLFPGSLDAVDHCARARHGRDPVRRRRRLPAAQDRPLGPLRRGRRQRARSTSTRSTSSTTSSGAPGRPLRARRRQGPDPRRRQGGLGQHG